MEQLINGYTIFFNNFYGLWNITHPEIGFCGQTKTEEEAKEYCING